MWPQLESSFSLIQLGGLEGGLHHRKLTFCIPLSATRPWGAEEGQLPSEAAPLATGNSSGKTELFYAWARSLGKGMETGMVCAGVWEGSISLFISISHFFLLYFMYFLHTL